MSQLKNKTIFITGASRGIGRAIALRCAQDGANVIITGKTSDPHPKLEGTIHSVAEEVSAAGGEALAIQLDVRDDAQLQAAVKQAADQFGGIDVLVNNASAILLAGTSEISMKRFDLLFGVNVRATFAASQACIPYLKKSDNPHIIALSPPLSMQGKYFKDHLAYTMSKYGMSMCVLGLAEELKKDGISVNALWPATTIATAAIKNNFPPEIYQASRKPEIVADAAHYIMTQPSGEMSGNFFTDEAVLKQSGVSDFKQYALNPDVPGFPDLFLD